MASQKISAMPAATTLADADLVPVVQGGVNKKAPYSLLQEQATKVPSSGLLGTLTNDNAAAGVVGEVISLDVLIADEVALTSNVITDLGTIVLTPGDWDVSGFVGFDCAGVTADWLRYGPALPGFTSLFYQTQIGSAIFGPPVGFNDIVSFPCSVSRLKVAAATTLTVHLLALALFSVGSVFAYGKLVARRAR